jgi:hypothetical protein
MKGRCTCIKKKRLAIPADKREMCLGIFQVEDSVEHHFSFFVSISLALIHSV